MTPEPVSRRSESDERFETVRHGIMAPASHLANGFAITRHDEAHEALASIQAELASVTAAGTYNSRLVTKLQTELAETKAENERLDNENKRLIEQLQGDG